MRTAITTRPVKVRYPGLPVSTLPAGTPVIIEGYDEFYDGTRTYIIETEVGEINESVPADALDFDADF